MISRVYRGGLQPELAVLCCFDQKAGHGRRSRASKTGSGSAIRTSTHPAQRSHSAASTERVMGFFDTYRQLHPVSREVLCGTADQFSAARHSMPRSGIRRPWRRPGGRRDEFAEPTSAPPHYQIVVLLKTRELERMMTPVGDRKTNRWHLQGRRALSSAGQPLHQRSAGEQDVRAHMPPLVVLGPSLTQSAPLAGHPYVREGIDFQQWCNL